MIGLGDVGEEIEGRLVAGDEARDLDPRDMIDALAEVEAAGSRGESEKPADEENDGSHTPEGQTALQPPPVDDQFSFGRHRAGSL